MGGQPFSTRPAYIESIRGLLRLHLLAETGQGESPAANAIRDSLERPWHDLSDAEKQRITGLSEDLYSIGQHSDPFLPMNPQAQRKLLEAIEARQSGDWDKGLELLRRWGKHLGPAVLSFLRGTVWEKAGDSETATVFYEHASRLDPGDDQFKCMYLFSLRKSDAAVALERAREITAIAGTCGPLVVVQAVDILATSTRGMPPVEARPILQQLIPVLEGALERLQSGEAGQFSVHESIHANVAFLLGFCYERLGEYCTALHYQNLGLSISPRNEALLVARGTLRYGVDRLAANDFELAIQFGSTMVWPYFFLAHHHLINNRFDTCRRMCERALELPGSEEVRANLNEWLAISEAELGFPGTLVRSAFEEAIRLAPDVDRIRRNLEEFERVSPEKTIGEHHWDKPSHSAVQSVGQEAGLLLAAEGPLAAA